MTGVLALGSFVVIVGAMVLVDLWRDPAVGHEIRKRARRRYEDFGSVWVNGLVNAFCALVNAAAVLQEALSGRIDATRKAGRNEPMKWLSALWTWVKSEPVATSQIAGAAIGVAVTFGLHISTPQKTAIDGFVFVVALVAGRQNSVSVPKAEALVSDARYEAVPDAPKPAQPPPLQAVKS